MNRSRVVVTGASGMVGRALVPRLVAAGHRCRLGVRDPSTLRERRSGPEDRVEVVPGDLRDAGTAERLVRDADAVVHLAGRVHRKGTLEEFRQANTEPTARLARRAADGGVRRFVFASTAAVYGPGGGPRFEDGPCAPATPYGRSKLETEQLLGGLADEMICTVLRPSVIYGPHDRGNTARMIRAIDRGWYVRIGDGSALKSMTYVENVADVILRCLEEDGGGTYNVSDPEPYSLRRVESEIAAALGRRPPRLTVPGPAATVAAAGLEAAFALLPWDPPVTRRDLRVLGRNNVVDVTRLERELGYASRVLLPEGIRQTIAWRRAQGFRRSDPTARSP